MTAYTIVLAFDAAGTDEDTAQYCAWLNDQGHDARVGNTSATTIKGGDLNQDDMDHAEKRNEVGNQLWNEFCNTY